MAKQWRLIPPLHVTAYAIARMLGYEHKDVAAEQQDLAQQDFIPVSTMSASEYDDKMRSLGLPVD